jgi:hypothetical protein
MTWGNAMARSLALVGLLVGFPLAARTEPTISHCDAGTVQALANAGPVGWRILDTGGEAVVGLADTTARCQEALYDGGDAYDEEDNWLFEIPNRWCEEDYFLIRVFEFERVPWDEIVVDDLSTVRDEMLFGALDGDLLPEPLTVGPEKTFVFEDLGWRTRYSHRYAMLHEAPGWYRWHFLITAPWTDGTEFVAEGVIEIVTHEEHVARVQSGAW